MVVGSAGVRGVLADGTFTLISLRIFICFLFFIFLFLRILNFYIIARMPGRAVFQKYIDQQKQAQNYRHKISTNLKINSKNPNDSAPRSYDFKPNSSFIVWSGPFERALV